MSTAPVVQRDERTVAIENASYRWAYLFLSFGLLALVAYRSLVHDESPWDMLALVVLSGILSVAYQGLNRVLTRRWATICLVTIILAAGIAAVTVWAR